MCQSAGDEVIDNARMVEDLLKLGSRRLSLARFQVRLAANVDRVETGKRSEATKLIGNRCLQDFDRFGWIVPLQLDGSANSGQEIILHHGSLRGRLVEFKRQLFGLCHIASPR